ncbi:MAG: hypothetical protein ACPLQS_01020 [Desulfurococcaceae archaeon]
MFSTTTTEKKSVKKTTPSSQLNLFHWSTERKELPRRKIIEYLEKILSESP